MINNKQKNVVKVFCANLMDIRSKAEMEYIKILEDDFGMAQYYDIFDSEDELKEFTEQMLSNAVLLNRFVAPRLYDLCAEVQARLGFTEQIDFYVQSTPELNAFSLNGFGFVPHIVCINSALIQLANDDELRFVIGHEIGHIVFQHNKLDFIRKFIFKEGEERVPAQISLIYLRCMHYAEISADRVGYLALPDINKVTTTLFKLHFGLPAESLNFQTEEYLKQLDRIRELGVGNLFTSHPNPMIRIQALLDFENSELASGKTSKEMTGQDLETKLKSLMETMEVHPKNEQEKQAVEFLSSVGMYLSFDQDDYASKYNMLYDFLSDYTTQPEKYMYFATPGDISKRMAAVCKYFAEKKDDTLFELIRKIIYLVLLDGRLESVEKTRLLEVAKLLDLGTDTMSYIIRQVSEAYLHPNNKSSLKRII